MAEKRKTWLVARGANWLASVPGTIDDWKGIAKRATPGGAVATASLMPQARGAAMDNPGWTYWGFVALVMLVTIWSIVRYIDDQRQESQKEVERAKQEGERKAEEERARAEAQQIHRATAGRIGDEWIHPHAARDIALTPETAEALVSAFIRQQPDAYRVDDEEPAVHRERFLLWLVRASPKGGVNAPATEG